MLRTLGLTAGMAALLAGSSAAWAASSPADFLKDGIQGDNAEIAIGQLAEQKGQSDQVKSFGRTLVADHTKAKQEKLSVAKSQNVAVNDDIAPEGKQTHDRLSKLSGTDFDRQFSTAMVEDHQKDIAKFRDEANAKAGPVSDLAAKELPVLQRHLQLAQSLTTADAGMGATSAGLAPPAGTDATATGATASTDNSRMAATDTTTQTDNAATSGTITQEGKDLWRATKLSGVDVYGPNQQKVGDIRDVLMDRNGKAEYVVVGVGGFLGIGEKDVAIALSQVTFSDGPAPGKSGSGSGNGNRAYPDHAEITMTKDQLNAAPAFHFAK